MDFPCGEYLLRQHIRDIAEYQAYQLYHPSDRSAVAFDSPAHEMWKNVLMRQHLSHEAKTARAAGLGDEAVRITKCYLDIFDRTKVAIETHNLTGCIGDESQRADWYPLAARACYDALVQGIIGIQGDPGGFQYVPCDMKGRMKLHNYRFMNSTWNIDISGAGPFVGRLILDGVPMQGTLRLPIAFRGRQNASACNRATASRHRARRWSLL